MPFYGPTGKSPETVAEWLFGDRKWRLLAVLARKPGDAYRVDQLIDTAGCSAPTVYEFLRALRPTQAIRQDDTAYALEPENDLAKALIDVVRALHPQAGRLVDRPPRTRRSTS
jgi:DNA-binding IclR family transcriptional regulator